MAVFFFDFLFPTIIISNVLSLFSPNHLSIFYSPCRVSSMCRNSPLRSTLDTNAITGLDIRQIIKEFTEAVYFVAF